MGLSSNVLWHQTNKDALLKILKEKCIRFSFSREYFPTSGLSYAFPMISLSDLPFSELDTFLGKYGDYMIGFSREWGHKNHFNPVLYCEQFSYVDQWVTNNLSSQTKCFDVISYIKPVEGPLPKRNMKVYRFYDEREVRLVLPPEKFTVLSDSEYEQYKKQNNGNSCTKMAIPFDLNDIKYIIVLNENNIAEVKKVLNNSNPSNSLPIILTKKQIEDDIIGKNHNVKISDIMNDDNIMIVE